MINPTTIPATAAREAERSAAVLPSQTVDYAAWLAHFERNRLNRPEPDWHAPILLSDAVIAPLVRSLEQFELGDGGGPDRLIAWNAASLCCNSPEMRRLVDLWFEEEAEHSRLLGGLVRRFDGAPIRGHWSFTAFCLSRKWFGVGFELTILLLTEIVSTAYYRVLTRRCADPTLTAACRLILRDEAGHVAFHRDRLARAGRAYGPLWATAFRALGLGAATMLWVNHRRAMNAVGGSDAEFYREAWTGLGRFIARLRRDARKLGG